MKGIPTLWKLRQDRVLTDTHVALYFWLRHQADEGRITTSTKLQAADRDVTDQWMRRLLNDLQEHGLIEISHNEKGKKQFVVEVTTGKENQKSFQEKQSDSPKSRNSNGQNRQTVKAQKVSKKVQQKQTSVSKSRNSETLSQNQQKVAEREIKDLGEKVETEKETTVTIQSFDFLPEVPENIRRARNPGLLGSEFSLRKENSSSGEGAAPLRGEAAPVPRVEEEEETTSPEEKRLNLLSEMMRIANEGGRNVN